MPTPISDRGDNIDLIPPEHASTISVPLKRKSSMDREEEEEKAKRVRREGIGSRAGEMEVMRRDRKSEDTMTGWRTVTATG